LRTCLGAGFIFGVGVGLAVGLEIYQKEIKPVETLRWSWSKAKNPLLYVLFIGAITGWGVGQPATLLLAGTGRLPFIGLTGLINLTVIVEIVIGLMFCLIVGPIVGFIAGMVTGELQTMAIPNQGIRRSARSAALGWGVTGLGSGLGSGLVAGIFIGADNGLVITLVVSLGVGLVAALLGGGFACILTFVDRIPI
jgi:hypothetical protein